MGSATKSDAAFATAQWHLQQGLDENFGQTDEATIAKYSHAALTARIRERGPTLTPQSPVLRFLPFACPMLPLTCNEIQRYRGNGRFAQAFDS